MRKLANYILYNNSFTLIVLFLTVSGGSVLAANEDVREAVGDTILNSDDAVVQVDNSYIISVNVDAHDFQMQVEAVSEDDDFYYVTYSYTSIEVVNGVWQSISREDVIQVAKEQLGERDLGLYIAEELKELSEAKRRLLVETQAIEKSLGHNTKVVERRYSGLVGRFLDPEEVTFDGYDPVVDEETIIVAVDNVGSAVESKDASINDETDEEDNPSEDDNENDNSSSGDGEISGGTEIATSTATSTDSVSVNESTATSTEAVIDSTPPVITLNGEASIELMIGDSYEELGFTATDEIDGDLSGEVNVSGAVDTTTPGTYEVTYTVEDVAGNQTEVVRTVVVAEEVVEESTDDDETTDNTQVGTSTPSS